MALVYQSAGTAAAASGASPTTIATTVALAVGDVLVVAMSYDNSGGGGADPLSAFAAAPATGAMTSLSAQSGLNDPGTASSGLATFATAYKVTTAIPSGTNISISWSGTAVVRAIAMAKVNSNALGTVNYRVNSGAAGTNVVASAAPALTTPSVNSGELVLCWAGHENGANIVGDADTTNGSWGTIITTFNGSAQTGMAIGIQGKTVTATATQTFNPTGTSSDWILGAIIFTEVLPVATFTQAAYQFFNDGTEAGSVSRAAVNTATTADLSNGDGEGLVRVRLQSTNSGADQLATDDYTLQYEKNANGTWIDAKSASLLASYPASNEDSTMIFGNLSSGAQGGAVAIQGNGQKLARVGFRLTKFGSPTTNISARVWSHSGSFGSGTPLGGAATFLAQSTTVVAASSISTTTGWVYFDFDGSFTLANATNYFIGLVTDATAGSDSNNNTFSSDASAPSYAGNSSRLTGYGGTTWQAYTPDLIFEVYTSSGGGAVIEFASAFLTDGEATTNRLGAGTGSFVAGKVSEDSTVDDLLITANNYTELLYSVLFKAAQFAATDTVRFRVVRNGATTGFTYTQTPTVNITQTFPAITQAAYRFYDDGTEAASVALAAQNTAYTASLTGGDVNLLLRARLQSTNIGRLPATDDWQLQFAKNGGAFQNAIASAVETLADTYASSNVDSGDAMGNATYQAAHAQSFLGDGKKLSRAGFWLNTQGAPTGTLTAQLFAHSGTFGAIGSLPTGAALTTSTAVSATTVGTVGSWIYFTFDKSVTLVSGTPYFISISYDLFNDVTNYLQIGYDNTTSTHAGIKAQFTFDVWNSALATDLAFQLYTTPLNEVIPFDSANLTDGAATTNRLGAGTGSFEAGKVSEDSLVDDLGWAGNNYTEVLYAIKLVANALTSSDALTFRVLHNGGTSDFTYTQTPTLSLSTGPQTRQATIATTFALTATATAVRTLPASISTAFALTATATSDVVHTAIIASTFALTATAAATVVVVATIQASISTAFGFAGTASAVRTLPATASGPFTFTTTATAVPQHEATVATAFTFTTTATAGVTQQATIATAFSFTTTAAAGVTQSATIATAFSWTATASASTNATIPATITTAFAFTTTAAAVPLHSATIATAFGFSTTATADLAHPATISTSFAFTTTATAVPLHPATIATAFTFTAAATAVTTLPAAIATTYVWTTTATALVIPPVQATITTAFAFTTTAAAIPVHPASIATAFAFTTTATALPLHPATIATQFTFATSAIAASFGNGEAAIVTVFAFTTTATGTVTRSAAVATQFTFTTTAAATPVHPATVATQFTFTAISTADLAHPAVVATQLTFVTTASAVPTHPASIATQFTFTAEATALPTVESAITTEFHFSTDAVAIPLHPAIITTEFVFATAAQAELGHEALAIGTYAFTASAAATVTTVAIVLNLATAVLIGNAHASAVYVGAVRAWPV